MLVIAIIGFVVIITWNSGKESSEEDLFADTLTADSNNNDELSYDNLMDRPTDSIREPATTTIDVPVATPVKDKKKKPTTTPKKKDSRPSTPPAANVSKKPSVGSAPDATKKPSSGAADVVKRPGSGAQDVTKRPTGSGAADAVKRP